MIRTIIAFFLLSLTACETQVVTHGLAPSDKELSLIKPGVHSRNDVRVILGSPSTLAQFDSKTWYYVGSQVQKKAFAKSSLVARKIVEVRFDSQGVVKTIESFDSSKEKEIKPIGRLTPTGGKKLTIIQQLVGNAGRFVARSDEPNSEN